MARAAGRGQDVVGPGGVVAEGHRRIRTDEDGTGVADPRGDRCRVTGLDLQVLGGVGVDDVEPGVEVVDEDDAGLGTGEGLGDPLAVLRGGDAADQRLLDRGRQLLAVGDEDRGGQRVVLGLADQVGGDVLGVGGVVGEDGDLGRAGLGVDPDEALEEPLGGDHPDVAGAGDQRHGHAVLVALGVAVGEHRDRLGAADGVHLVDAEEGAGGEDGRVGVPRQLAGVLLLRRAGDGEGADAGELRRDDVHDHAGRVDGQAAGHVEADPVDRDPPLGDRAAGDDLGRRVGALLVGVDQPGATDRLLEGGPQRRVEPVEGVLQHLGRDPQVLRPDAVELLAEVAQRVRPAMPDVLDDRADLVQRRLDVELGARQRGPQGAHLERASPQVESGHHGVKSRFRPDPRPDARPRSQVRRRGPSRAHVPSDCR